MGDGLGIHYKSQPLAAKQDVEQQEREEVEVGEFWQQDEEQVVKRRIAVSRGPTDRMTSRAKVSLQV